MNRHVYLDYNATTPLREGVKKVMIEAMEDFGNPSSIHKFGRTARARIENARDILSAYLGVKPEQVFFTSGGTEANNAVIGSHSDCVLMISTIEHESVEKAAPGSYKIEVNAEGLIDLGKLEEALASLRGQKILISAMLANNETGILQPIQQVVEIARKYKALVHCDAVTAFTKVPFSYEELGVDYLTLSAHKIGGPKGCGAVIVPFNVQLPSLLHGGGQEKGHRAGTENLLGIVGFGQAIQDAPNDNWQAVQSLRELLENLIMGAVPKTVIYGINSPRLPNTTFISMVGVHTQTQLMAFDLEGFAVSSGSACSSGKITGSKVLKAMGVNDLEASQALRVSLGWATTRQEIEDFAKAWITLYNRYKNG